MGLNPQCEITLISPGSATLYVCPILKCLIIVLCALGSPPIMLPLYPAIAKSCIESLQATQPKRFTD